MGDRRSDDPVGPLAPRPACHCLEKTTLKTRTPLFFEGPCFFAEGLVFSTLGKNNPQKTTSQNVGNNRPKRLPYLGRGFGGFAFEVLPPDIGEKGRNTAPKHV